VHRVADYGTFWASAVIDALRVDRHDVVLALTTPPLIATGAALACRARRVPLVGWVQDVYPEVAARFGVIDEASLAYKALHTATRATHGSSTRIVALSDRMRERLVEQGAPAAKVRVIPNWADGAHVRPVPRGENDFRRQHGIEDRFVALYSGNLGVGHEFETFMAAAKHLERACPEVLFLFVGDGARKAEAQRLAEGLGNVRFLPYQKRESLAASLSSADVHLISLREGLDGLLVPSKLYGAMASARPIYFVGPAGCEVARVVREHGIGWSGSPGESVGLANALTRAVSEPQQTERLGLEARRVFEERFERKRALARFREVLAEAAGS
jgi:glycosyltransferase involved in cell wall biosynthesis